MSEMQKISFLFFASTSLTDAADVVAEEQAVLLILLVAQLCHEAVHDGIPLSKVDNLHRC